MKILAWIITPVFMFVIHSMKELDKLGEDTDYFFLLIVPFAIAQIIYWYLLFNGIAFLFGLGS